MARDAAPGKEGGRGAGGIRPVLESDGEVRTPVSQLQTQEIPQASETPFVAMGGAGVSVWGMGVNPWFAARSPAVPEPCGWDVCGWQFELLQLCSCFIPDLELELEFHPIVAKLDQQKD